MSLTPAKIAAALRVQPGRVAAIWPLIVAGLQEFGIDSDLVQVAAAATIAVECRSWIPCREKHASKERQPELWRLQERYWPSGYYGRGLTQTTWRDNYVLLEKVLGIPCVANPDLLLVPVNAARALAYFFATHGIAPNAKARNWRGVRIRVNGGTTAMEEFMTAVDALLEVV